MKDKLKRILALLMVVIVPVTFFLVGCGATATSTVRGVTFVSNLYDEETGYAIFEVDLNIPTTLEYRVNPSTWSGYSVRFTTSDSAGENNKKYNDSSNGYVVTVIDSTFKEIKKKVHINGYEDTCIVRLKEYPIEIYADSSEINLNAGGVYTIPLYGVFDNGDGTTTTKLLSEKEYNFLVEVDDPTILEISNDARLKVCSIRSNLGTANVTITLLNTHGDTTFYDDEGNLVSALTTKITVNIMQNAGSAYVGLGSACDEFVSDGDTVLVELSSDYQTSSDNEYYYLDISLYVFSVSNIYTETSFYCVTSNTKYVDFVSDEDGDSLVIYLTKSNFNSVDSYTIDVKVWTPLIDDDSKSFSVNFSLLLTLAE